MRREWGRNAPSVEPRLNLSKLLLIYLTFTEGSEKYKTNSEELFYQSKRNIFINKLAEILSLKNTVYSFN
jgi:hypothetical protein